MSTNGRAELQRYREDQLRVTFTRVWWAVVDGGWDRRGLDRGLYRMVFEGMSRVSAVDASDVVEVHRLSGVTSCWWHWPEGADDVQKITLDEARRLYGGK